MVSLEYFIDIILPSTLWPWGGSACNRSEYQEYFLGGKGGQCVGLTTLPPSCADCLEIWEPQPPGTLGLSRPVMGLLYLFTTGKALVWSLSESSNTAMAVTAADDDYDKIWRK